MKTNHIIIQSGLFVACALVFTLTACDRDGWLRGNGPQITTTRSLQGYDQVKLNIPAKLYYTIDSVYRFSISAQGNIEPHLETEVRGTTLHISWKPRLHVRGHSPIEIHLSGPHPSLLHVNGSGEMYMQQPIRSERLDLDVNGSGDIDVPAFYGDAWDASVNGSGKIEMRGGSSKESYLDVNGSGDIVALQHTGNKVYAEISGSGEIGIGAADELEANISGSGKVMYRGNPRTKINISGSGRVSHEP
jgi:hypothetical protein